ncbi:MAG: glutamyl-tRNA reductase [Verrucomicrobiales bacterium]|nr:glutamyl-tRNA reductase [Verrucomicrobiales bacterium]|tara:strand:- start:1365 stop:2426 length:1062 start_codon:yes stop_codon:yes gene_type:complete
MEIVVIGISHHTAPVELRERYSIADSFLPDALTQLREIDGFEEAVILSTCNRTEIYAAVTIDSLQATRRLREFISSLKDLGNPDAEEVYELTQPKSVEHLFKVASGLDSMVLGETEILGQIKQAYQTALEHKHTGKALNKAFQSSFNVAKKIRTDTNIQRGSVSVASVAVELAQKIFESLDHHHVMVIGAGDTSEKTARALLSRGAKSVMVSNRSFDRAEALANELGGRAIRFDDWPTEFPSVDIVISSTTAPKYLITRKKLEPLMHKREGRPLLLIDIAVPRDIEPEINFLDDVYVFNVDDLQAIADEYLRLRKEELAVCEQIIMDKAGELTHQRTPRTGGDVEFGLQGGSA